MDHLNHFYDQYESLELAPKNESMKLEIHRLSSYKKFPAQVRMSVLKLSKAGFYHTGLQDETACFACDLKLQDWDETLNPFVMHSRYSPDCPFVNNNIECFPLGESVPSRDSFTLAQRASEGQGLGMPSGGCPATVSRNGAQFTQGLGGMASDHRPPPAPQSDSVAVKQPPGDQSPSFLRAPVEAVPEQNSSRGNLAHRQSPPRDMHPGDFQRTSLDFQRTSLSPTSTIRNTRPAWKKDYRYERSRLNSFRTWPSNASVRPSDLAQAGFYYMGTDDRVQCVFCRGILRNWEPEDDAFSEHRRHFGQCPFLVNPEEVGNVRLGREDFPVDGSTPGSTDQELNIHASNAVEVLPPAEDYCRGIVKDKPHHPNYALPADRLKTYKDFPTMTQTPEQFTRAGFFYSGIADNVKCFFCDGGLRNWEPNDDPWTEHGRWFPRCGYIRLCKGDEFIKEVQQKFAPPPQDAKPQNLRNSHKSKKFPVDVARLTNALTSRTVQSVIEMGWESDMVREVVKRRLQDLDDDFPNAESLLDSLHEYEMELKYIDTHGDSDNSTDMKTSNDSNDTQEAETVKEEAAKKKSKKKKKKKKAGQRGGEELNTEGRTNTGEDTHEPYQYIDDEEAKRLAEDIQRMKDERLCKVCMDEEVNIVFLRCGHLVCCSNCAPALRHCPICRELIRGTVRVFLS